MENTTAGRNAAQRRRLRTWAVWAGGAEALDGALVRAVAPAIEQVAPERWSFVRWTGDRGPCLHVTLDAADEGATEFGGLVERRLAGACGDMPRREPLVPRPLRHADAPAAAVREMAPHVGEEERLGALHRTSSAVVLRMLPELGNGLQRAALGMALMATTGQASPVRPADPDLWRDAARRHVGGDERGRGILDALARRAAELRDELVRTALAQRRSEAIADGLARYADACGDLRDADAVLRHAHLSCSRLGVAPLEEVLLALVLAGDGGRRAPVGRAVMRLESVSKRNDEKDVLDDVTLTVSEGEVFALLGPPGAGKSSLLGVAAGLRLLSSGTARVLGRDPRAARRDGEAAIELAMPDAELAGEPSVRESIELSLRASAGDTSADIEAVLEDTGLRELAATAVAELEPGARRRLAIACALVREPGVLLLDEPTAGLQAVERDEVWQLVGARRERGGTTVIATTSLQEARCVADRAGLIVDGALRAVGSPARIAGEFFPEGTLRFHVVDKPDRALLEELPDVDAIDIDERVDHWAVELATRQPAELLALLEADADFPEIHNADAEQPSTAAAGSRA